MHGGCWRTSSSDWPSSGLLLHEDKPPDRVWPLAGLGSTTTRRVASGNLRLPRPHPLLRVDPGRQVHREAQDTEQAPDAQAEGTAPGGVAAHARATGRAYANVPRGHCGYYGVSHNFPALSAFHQAVRCIWRRCLRRRSQKARRMDWDRFKAVLTRSLCLSRESLIRGRRARRDAGYPREEPGRGKAALPDLRAKAEWLSYSTVNPRQSWNVLLERVRSRKIIYL